MVTSLRTKMILDLCKNKSVLDIGCVGHSATTEKGDTWIHKRIKEVAAELIGLDYEKEEIKILNELGYNIIYGDAENFNLKRKFDIIMCGELIEHLFNTGSFLDCIKQHMHNNSILIITTPNAFAHRRMIGTLLNGSLNENLEHTSYYSDTTMKQLLIRKGFKNIKVDYIKSDDNNLFRVFLENILNILLRKQTRTILFVTARFA